MTFIALTSPKLWGNIDSIGKKNEMVPETVSDIGSYEITRGVI